MELIEDLAIVKEVEPDRVKVEIPRSENCKSCSAHSICHINDKPVQHWITSNLKLEEGDYVRIFISPNLRITSSFIVFLLPVLVMLFFYLIPRQLLGLSENISILISILSLGLSGIIIYILDKGWGSRINFEIVEKLSAQELKEFEKNED